MDLGSDADRGEVGESALAGLIGLAWPLTAPSARCALEELDSEADLLRSDSCAAVGMGGSGLFVMLPLGRFSSRSD